MSMKRRRDHAAWYALRRDAGEGLSTFQQRTVRLLQQELERIGARLVNVSTAPMLDDPDEIYWHGEIAGTPLGFTILFGSAYLGGDDVDVRLEEPDWESPDALGDAFVAEVVAHAGRWPRSPGGAS
jgi:hypothetical protein